MQESRAIGKPEMGFFVMRIVKGGPLVPARIWMPCTCTVNGGGDDAINPNAVHDWRETCDRYPRDLAGDIDGRPADVDRIWTGAKVTTEANWRFLMADHEWCRQHAEDQPEARPWEPVDLATQPPIF